MKKIILMSLIIGCFGFLFGAPPTKYSEQTILNRVFNDEDGNISFDTKFSPQNVLNMAFDEDKNSLRASLVSPVSISTITFSDGTILTSTKTLGGLSTELDPVFISSGVKISGDTMTGNLKVGTNLITLSSGTFGSISTNEIRSPNAVYFRDSVSTRAVIGNIEGKTGIHLKVGHLYLSDVQRLTDDGRIRAAAGGSATTPAFSFADAGQTDNGFSNLESNDQIQTICGGIVISTFSITGLDSHLSITAPNITAIALSTGTLVRKSGDTMSGNLTTTSSITIEGSEFSVGGSTFVVKGGSVGIGTASPTTNLQIGSLSSVQTATPTMLNMGGTYANEVVSSKAKWKLYDNGTTINTYGIGISVGQFNFFKYTGGSYNWYFSDIEKMRLTGAGLLGINTPTPTYQLDVNGGAIIRSSMTVVGETFVSTMTVSGQIVLKDGTILTSTATLVSKAGDTMTGTLTIQAGDGFGSHQLLNLIGINNPTVNFKDNRGECLTYLQQSSDNFYLSVNRDAVIGTINDTGKTNCSMYLSVSSGDSNISFYTSSINNEGGILRLTIDKGGNVYPGGNKTQNLGSPALSWEKIYVSSIFVTTPDLIKKEEAYNWLVGISTKPRAGTVSKIDKATYGNAYRKAREEDKIERQVKVDLDYNELPPNNEEIIVETLMGGTTNYYYEKTEILLPEDAIDLGQSMINMIYLNKKLLDEIADLKSRITTLELR